MAMPRKAKELSALEVARLKRPTLNMVGGVDGLGLKVAETGARSWILRFALDGRRFDMGLGGFPDVPLADARAAARDAKAKVRLGVNPITAAQEMRSAEAAKRAATKTFAECSAAFIKAKAPGWKNAKHAAQWAATLGTYADPVVGSLLVQDVTSTHVHTILDPIWVSKHETATRVRSRIENVLDWAIARGYRQGPNPARWKANLQQMLAEPSKVAKVVHHAALPVDAMGAFMAALRAAEGQGARALELAILTAARSGEVRGATWSEIDLQAGEWNVPGDRMKMGKPHRVALSSAAIALLRALPQCKPDELIFPAPKGGTLSDMTLTAVCRRMKVDAVPHGFRATFRTWAAERTNFPREVVEAALAHVIESEVERAYQRSDLFDKRTRLMQAWADFCGQTSTAKVIPMKRNRAART